MNEERTINISAAQEGQQMTDDWGPPINSFQMGTSRDMNTTIVIFNTVMGGRTYLELPNMDMIAFAETIIKAARASKELRKKQKKGVAVGRRGA